MTSFVRSARALCTLALAFAAGCAQNLTPQNLPASYEPQVRARSTPRLLYVSDAGVNTVYAFPVDRSNPVPVEKISGLNTPFGLAVDSANDLFVAQARGGNILEFAPGSTKRLRTLQFPGIGPSALAIDPHGVLFVAGTQGVVCEYQPGKTTPSKTFRVLPGRNVVSMGAIAFDGSGNLYAAFVPLLEKPAHVFKFAPGSETGVDLNLDIKTNWNEPGLAFDSKNNLYIGNYLAIDVFPPASREPSESIDSYQPNPPGFFTIGERERIFVPRRDIVTFEGVIDGFVQEFSAGGVSETAQITTLVNPLGAALSK